MADSFPYGNDLSTPETWVGRMDTKSRTWLVSYDGSLSVICGYHTFIFLGLENLCIAAVDLKNCGVSAGLPIGKLLGGAGDAARSAERVDEGLDAAGRAKQIGDAVSTNQAYAQISEGMKLFDRMKAGIPQFMRANVPFSLNDLWGCTGGIIGAEVELIAGAAGYFIDAAPNPVSKPLFGPQFIANTGDGLVSAGLTAAIGVWDVDVDQNYNLYWELGAASNAQCLRENRSPQYDQPYNQIAAGLHPYLASLPPAGCNLADIGFDPQAVLR
ncbi:MAG: hypothetical protein ACRBCL_04100 [Maritimibacter sp.]